jgi:hypothetical protein
MNFLKAVCHTWNMILFKMLTIIFKRFPIWLLLLTKYKEKVCLGAV